jgi:Fe-S cluster assembly ATPase SufC
MLEIKNLHVKLADEDRVILKGLSLEVPKGEVHAIMGPNGSGKSTLAYVLAGRDGYEVTEGNILWNGESILDMEPDVRAAKGVFLAFDGNSGGRGPDVSAHGAQCVEEKARRKGTDDARLHEARQGEGQ